MTSTVADVYTALETLAGTALPAFQIVPGQVGTYIAQQQLLLGDATGTETPKTLASGWMAEAYEITCELHCYTGGQDIAAVRTAVITAWQSLRTAIDADHTLGISDAMEAWISNYTVKAGYASNPSGEPVGVSAQCQFTVRITNLTT